MSATCGRATRTATLWDLTVDIGTTTVAAQLVDLDDGPVTGD